MKKMLFCGVLLLSIVTFGSILADMTIDGGGNVLELSETGSLVVQAGSTLTLKNLTLQGLSGTRLIMESSTSRLVLNDVEICLDGDYSFSNGAMVFEQNVKISGADHTFAYVTAMTSTITTCATLMLDFCLNFSYSPRGTSDQPASKINQLIEFKDRSSRLFLNGVTSLVATNTGLRLHTGTLIADHKNTLEAGPNYGPTTGILFGDGSSSANNLKVITLPAASITTTTGFFEIQNV